MQNPLHNIVILGSGNVATWLANKLNKAGHAILQVYSRSVEHARALSDKIGALHTNSVEDIIRNADIYIIAVSDDAIAALAGKLRVDKSLVVHTSGTVDMVVLKSASENYGVFYPFQTIRKEKDFQNLEVPVIVEAVSDKNLNLLIQLAKEIHSEYFVVSGEKRKYLHLAGVFINNFVNHLYTIGENLLAEKDIDVAMLKPITRETLRMLETMGPDDLQTGPAIRNDVITIKKHLQLLEDSPYAEVYDCMTKSILKYYEKQVY